MIMRSHCGCSGTLQHPGIIFLTMQELFERVTEMQSEKSTEISLSYLEIYNETIRDLLEQGGPKGGLMLREDAHQAVSVSGLSTHHPQNVRQDFDYYGFRSLTLPLGSRGHGHDYSGQ